LFDMAWFGGAASVGAANVAPESLPEFETQPKSTSWASKVDGARNKVHKQMSSLLQKGRAWGTKGVVFARPRVQVCATHAYKQTDTL